jgi:deoxyinosine 3'endonuclease (endonuclease V)
LMGQGDGAQHRSVFGWARHVGLSPPSRNRHTVGCARAGGTKAEARERTALP